MPERVRGVAHPDDVDFGAAGTVATWTEQGIDVVYCIVTDGEAGGSDRSVDRADMAALRREEQTAAAKVLGVTDLHFLGHPDGRLYPTLDLRRDISRVSDRAAHAVLTQSPERSFPADLREPSRSSLRARRRSAVYPARATRSRSPSCSSPASSPGPCPRSG
jgi:LmbE family N-acetylglucosaminyl deacetylase